MQNVRLALRADRYVDLEAAYLPGLVPLLLGGMVMLSGVILSVCSGMMRAWIDLTPAKDGVRVVVRLAGPVFPGERAERLLGLVLARARARGATGMEAPASDISPGDGDAPAAPPAGGAPAGGG